MTKNEVFIKNNKIIPKKEWDDLVSSWKEVEENPGLDDVKELIKKAIIERVTDKKVGVMFSGGIDSTLIAKVLADELGNKNVILVSVGCFDEGRKYPDDLVVAEKLADELGLELYKVELSHDETVNVFTETINLLRKEGEEYVNSVNVSVGAVEVAAFKKFNELSISEVFAGLGSEEVFAGYLRHESSEDLIDTSFESLKDMRDRDLVREVCLASHFKIKGRTPFMDENLLRLTFCMDKKIKLNNQENKVAVRELGKDLKLSNAERKKKAAQYGSRTQAFLSKECNIRGFDKISECLKKWN